MALYLRGKLLKNKKKEQKQLVIVSNLRVAFLWIIDDEGRMFAASFRLYYKYNLLEK